MRTEVKITAKSPYNEYEIGDVGYVDGYVRGGDDVPYACVVIYGRKSVRLVPTHSLEVIGLITKTNSQPSNTQ